MEIWNHVCIKYFSIRREELRNNTSRNNRTKMLIFTSLYCLPLLFQDKLSVFLSGYRTPNEEVAGTVIIKSVIRR